MAEKFAAILSRLKSAPVIYDLTARALKSSFATEREEHELAVTQLTGEIERLGKRIEAVYTDKLVGKSSTEYYKLASSQWQDEMRRCHNELRRYQDASEAYMNVSIRRVPRKICAPETAACAHMSALMSVLTSAASESYDTNSGVERHGTSPQLA